MKIYDLRKKDGTPIQTEIFDRYIQHENSPLPDILYEIGLIKNNITRDGVSHIQSLSIKDGFDATKYKYDWINTKKVNDTISKFNTIRANDMWFIATENKSISTQPSIKSNYFFNIDRTNNPICLFRDNGGSIDSKYGYTWNDIISMIRNNDYYRYFKDNDYIELIIDNYIYTMRFNIDIYYDYSYGTPYANSRGSLNNNIPHHIDLISDEVVPLSNTQFLDINNFDIKTAPTICSPGSNGMNLYQSTSISMWNKYYNKFSQSLRSIIIPKYCIIGDRQSTNISVGMNKYSNTPIGHLWQPREAEVIGQAYLSDHWYDSLLCIQYPSFKYTGVRKFVAKRVDANTKPTGGRYVTWSLRDKGNETIFVNEYGELMYSSGSQSSVSNLLCFRIA